MTNDNKGLDSAIKLDKDFIKVLVVIGPIALFLTWLALRQEPTVTLIAGLIVIPFFGSVFVRALVQLARVSFIRKEVARRQWIVFAVSLLFLLVLFAIGHSRKDSVRYAIVVPGAWAFLTIIFYNFLNKKRG